MNEAFYKVSSELLSRTDITAFDKLLVSVLCSRNKFFKENGQLHYDKLSDLASVLGASRRTVERSLSDLIAKGLVVADKISITDLSCARNGQASKVDAKKSVITKWVFKDVFVSGPSITLKAQAQSVSHGSTYDEDEDLPF